MSGAPRRVLVAGTSGVGKTTLATRVAERLDLPRTEIDALFHGPGWQPRPEFLDDVRALAARDRWVVEWQYPEARPVLADRADLLVWLDLPVRTQVARLVRRTVRRRLARAELWNGNREAPLRHVLTDPDHVVRWGWRARHDARRHVPALATSHPDLPVVRLASQADVERWLDGLGRGPGVSGDAAGARP